MARLTSGTLVAGLTAAAIATVGVLAAQASGSPVRTPALGRTAASAARSPRGNPAYALPPDSGSGQRVVFSVVDERVWLVGADDRVVRTYRVLEGNVLPSVGTHEVFARRAQGVGGDGRRVEHAVLFASVDGTNVGFSAAVDGSLTRPDPATQTAAIREHRPDGDALWRQATIGSPVEVVR